MGKIQILPDNLANKIAAGEVVQRPESVVKELLENSIDAGATIIELFIKRSGKSLIQVIDNGDGMTEEDAILSIQKHATSKIYSYEDLEAIKTLGFRGEALSSIASVSQLEIRTETKTAEFGTLLRVEDDNSVHVEKGSFPKGTSVQIKNLFFNTPARRNFLKTDTTELKHIVDTFNKTALSHHELTFRLFIDDDLVLDFTAGTIEERLKQVFGEPIFNALVYVEEKTDLLSAYGYVGKPSLLKRNKGEQYVFINGRYIQSKQINHAVFTAYENILEKGDYPFFIFYIDLDPVKIDINVHPSKLEVRFENEKDIYSFILAVVKKGLSSYDLVPNLALGAPDEDFSMRSSFKPGVPVSRSDFSDRPAPRPIPEVRLSEREIDAVFSSVEQNIDKRSLPVNNLPFDFPSQAGGGQTATSLGTTVDSSNMPQQDAFLVQLQNRYIITPIKSGLMIIDQHVAHERILYEKALNLFETNLPLSQQLLFPKTVQVNPGVFLTLKELNPYLTKLGFELKFFSKNSVVIEGVPQELTTDEEEKILMEIVDEYIYNQKVRKILDDKDNIAKSFSCRSAIKSGNKLTDKEMRLLIDSLFATSMPYVCPHGRPVVLKISMDEFDKRFGRT
jgi:DNA mismatch repair protein MutL